MTKRRRIYEVSGKVLFESPEPGTIVQYIKDDTSHNTRSGIITGKGVLNNRISEHLMTRLGEMDQIFPIALRVNDFLSGLFLGVKLRLVDVRLEFSRLWDNDHTLIVLADEISQDNCRLWDLHTIEKLDKGRFREELGRVEEAYQEVVKRLGILPESSPGDLPGPNSIQ